MMKVDIPCPCPTPHESDTVTLRDTLDFHRATTITKAIGFIETDDDKSRPAEVLAVLSEYYVLMGIEAWTLRGPKAIPVTPANIRTYILERLDIAAVVVEAADELYSKAILLPLLARASSSSPPTPTNGQTSRKPSGGRRRSPRPSKPSSISTTPTVAIVTTSSSLDGVSSSSQSSESAA